MENDTSTWKTCTKCGARKTLEAFHKHAPAKDGHASACKKCRLTHLKKWYLDNSEKAKARARSWQELNYEKHLANVAAYSKLHPERNFHQNALRQIRAKPVAGRISAARLAAKAQMFSGCWMCGSPANCWDHVKPLAKGGLHVLSNLRPACTPCNLYKHAKWFGPRNLDLLKRS